MSKYTLRGSQALDERIDADLEIITNAVSTHCEALILLGGYGRGEGTPYLLPDGSQAPFNDYDLVVIVDTVNTAVRLHFNALEKELTERIGLPVDLCPYARHELPSREFSLLNYEMKNGHMVLWGDEHILDALPDYDPAAIPLTEGARLLLNRGKLLLDIKRRLADSSPLSDEERIRFIKFLQKVLLAFGDSALLVEGQYDIHYAVKKNRITSLSDIPSREAILAGYLQAVELKEWGDFQALENVDIKQEFNRIVSIYIDYMSWFLDQCPGRECSIPKAVALNLKWNKTFSTRHPRARLYRAIIELLQDRSALSHEQFYALQRRFS